MPHDTHQIRILSHRACLQGCDPAGENTLPALIRAAALGFDTEFDVNRDAETGRLVLTHDPQPWSAERDATIWLTQRQEGALHALNLKDLSAATAICELLISAGTQGQFFLFDFELLAADRTDCLTLMQSLGEAGLAIAYRVSEREPFFDEYLRDDAAQTLWLDEFALPWVTSCHIRALREAGKHTFYVSPDLHGCRDASDLQRRWEPLIEAGVTGICTDYPRLLARFVGVAGS